MARFTFNFCVEEVTPGDHEEGSSNYKKEENTRPELLDRENSGEHSCSSVLNSTNSVQSVIEKGRASKEHPVLPYHKELLDHVIPSKFQLSSSHKLQILYVDANSVEKYEIQCQCHAIRRTTDAKNRHQSPCDSVDRECGLLRPLLELSNSFHSDLIPGVYEGGLKVWECAFDLVEYLAESDIDFSGMHVLELGCGAGLPAIFALIKGAREVHFQDYNPEVIDHVTIPSVLVNIAESKSTYCSYKFYSGDWSNFTQLIPSRYYDIILTSETIYSSASQPKVLAALKCLLRPQGGVAYIAAKSYYFGVGGSVSSFTELVEKDGYFNIEKCHIVDCEISREILKLQPHAIGSTPPA